MRYAYCALRLFGGCLGSGTRMSRGLNPKRAEAALRRAANRALYGSRDDRSGRIVSSAITSAKYDPEATALEIRFVTGRTYRYADVPPGGVVLVDGALLLGRGLPFDLTVHLALSPAALARRTGGDDAWTLPAYARYEEEARPLRTADVAVKLDDPRHPALITEA